MFSMQIGIGMPAGANILNRAMGIAGGGVSMGFVAGSQGTMAFAGAFGQDMTGFSPEAMMGCGPSNFCHPLMNNNFGMPNMGFNNGMGMIPGMNQGIGQNGMQNPMMMMMMMQMMMMMMQMMQQQGMGGNMMQNMMPGMMNGMPGFGMPMNMGMPGFGNPGMTSFGSPISMAPPYGHSRPLPPFAAGSGSPSGGYSSPVAAGNPINPGQSGSAAVDLARRFLGQESYRIKGQMPNFTAAGGQTNNCADFVSSALESTGRLQGHQINVGRLEEALRQQGYVRVPAEQSRPGDVWISNGRGHTELVSEAGGRRTIGSNNDRPGHQVISERAKSTTSGVYYQLREDR